VNGDSSTLLPYRGAGEETLKFLSRRMSALVDS
jgi:hypothetical protein